MATSVHAAWPAILVLLALAAAGIALAPRIADDPLGAGFLALWLAVVAALMAAVLRRARGAPDRATGGPPAGEGVNERLRDLDRRGASRRRRQSLPPDR